MLKIRPFLGVNGILLILIGLFFFFKPGLALNISIIIIGLELFLSGIVGIFAVWIDKNHPYRGAMLLLTLAWIVMGICLLIFPKIGHFLVSLLVVISGIFLMIRSFFVIADGLNAKQLGIATRWLQVVLGVLGGLFGLFLIMNAFLTIIVLNILLGISLLFSGIYLLAFAFKKRNVVEKEEYIEHLEEDDV